MVACLDLDSRANDEAALTPSPSEFPTQSFCWEIEKDLKVLKLPESASQMPSQSRLSSFLHPSGVKRVMLSYSGIEFILMSGLDWMWNQSNPRNDFLNPTTTPFEYAVDSSWCTSSSEVTEACNASDSLGSGLITVMGLVVDSDSLWIMLNSFCVPKTVAEHHWDHPWPPPKTSFWFSLPGRFAWQWRSLGSMEDLSSTVLKLLNSARKNNLYNREAMMARLKYLLINVLGNASGSASGIPSFFRSCISWSSDTSSSRVRSSTSASSFPFQQVFEGFSLEKNRKTGTFYWSLTLPLEPMPQKLGKYSHLWYYKSS